MSLSKVIVRVNMDISFHILECWQILFESEYFSYFTLPKKFFYVSDMNFIELMTDCKSSLFSLMRWNNLIRLYAAVIVNIRF